MTHVESPFNHKFLHVRSRDGRCTYSWKKDEGTIHETVLTCGQEEGHEWHDDPKKCNGIAPCPEHGRGPCPPREAVDHPKHYGGGDDPFEHVKVAEAKGWGYHIGNCTKYLWRMGLKVGADDLEDLKKARWYLDRFIKLVEKERNRSNEPGMDGFTRQRPGGVVLSHHAKCSDKTVDHVICSWVNQ